MAKKKKKAGGRPLVGNKRVCISIPPELLAKIDQAAKARDVNRSAFVEFALQIALDGLE